MTKPTLFVTRKLPESVEAALAERYDTELNAVDHPLDRDTLARAMRDHDAILPTITDRIDAALLDIPGRSVRIVANYGAGFDHIDVEAARSAGVVVTNTPGALTEATAELAILLMLMAARRAGEGERELRRGDWIGWRPTHLVGQGLTGRTLGLVGFGRIARATAQKARGLGMVIRYHSRTAAPPEVEAALGATRSLTLAGLASESDVLSIHVPGGDPTHHLVDAAILSAMRPTAVLINTARGSVVDEAALGAALAAGTIGGAGLDVYESEPVIHPLLLENERVVLLPHLGSATVEARTAMGLRAAANLDAFFAGIEPADRVA